MSTASSAASVHAEDRSERRQHWIAVLLSGLLHVGFLLLLLWSSPVTVTPPQAGGGGSRVAVDFVGATPPTPLPPALTVPPTPPTAKRPAKSRVQSTLVIQAPDPVPPDAPEESVQAPAPAVAAAPPPTPPRRTRNFGRPPGMLAETTAPENSGPTRGPALGRGTGSGSSAGQPSMEVGGYQVYYDLLSEIRLRAWRDRGMTEVFMPLPGTRRYMVCPLETALRRESGPCRLLEPDSPELANIGDAREVITMERVYRQGQVVWSGPGPYK